VKSSLGKPLEGPRKTKDPIGKGWRLCGKALSEWTARGKVPWRHRREGIPLHNFSLSMFIWPRGWSATPILLLSFLGDDVRVAEAKSFLSNGTKIRYIF